MKNIVTRSSGLRLSQISLIVGLLLCIGLQQVTASLYAETFSYFIAMMGMGMAFVLVSRMRNRDSFWWFALASTGSNSFWYISIALLLVADVPLYFVLLALPALLAGRTFGVRVAMHIEKKHELLSDVVANPRSIEKYAHTALRGWLILGALLIVYMLLLLFVQPEMARVGAVVVGLGFLQNFFYAQSTRLAQRGKENSATIAPLAMLKVASSVTFFCSFAYLAHNELPALLFVPYTLTTVLGSTYGIMRSMLREAKMGVAGDDHIHATDQKRLRQLVGGSFAELSKTSRLVYGGLFATGFVWLALHETLASYMGLVLPVLQFPVGDVETTRTVIVLTIAGFLFLQELTHTLVASAAVRNHVTYHAVCITLDISFDFLKVLVILKNPTWDIVPIVVVASTTGLLFGRALSVKIEQLLKATMDERQ